MQKLVTIYLSDDSGNTCQEEHLSDYLNDGWRVVSTTAVGAGAGEGAGGASSFDGRSYVAGWLAVVIEKP